MSHPPTRTRAPNHEPHPDKSKKKVKTQDHIGAPMWAKGSQFDYLWSFIDEFNESQPRSKVRKDLVKKVAVLYITKYGWDCVEDPEALDPNPDDLVALSKALEGVGEEQIEARKRILVDFREQLGFWFRHHSKKVLRPSKNNPLVPKRVTQESLLAPRKPRFDHVYADLYFDSDLQEIFDDEKVALEEQGLKVNSFLLRNKIVSDAWERAPQELKDEVYAEVDKRHAEVMKEYQEYLAEKPSDAELLEALNNSAAFIQPLVDRLAGLYGWKVSLMMAGEVPGEPGVSLKSWQAGPGQDWGQVDKLGWKAACESFLKCAARIHSTTVPTSTEHLDRMTPFNSQGPELPAAGPALSSLNPPAATSSGAAVSASRAAPSTGIGASTTVPATAASSMATSSTATPSMATAPTTASPSTAAPSMDPAPSTATPSSAVPPSATTPSATAPSATAPSAVPPSATTPSATAPSATAPSAVPPSATTPSATTPSATAPSATAPSATAPSATAPSATAPSATAPVVKEHGVPRTIPFDEAALWLQNLQAYLKQGQSLSENWSRLLALLCTHEMLAGFPDKQGNLISAKVRPKCVTTWINSGRPDKPYFIQKKIGLNCAGFANAFGTWWEALRPLNDGTESDFSRLNVPGINGVVSLIVLLMWWGLKVHEVGEDATAWEQALEEVCATIEEMNGLNGDDEEDEEDNEANELPVVVKAKRGTKSSTRARKRRRC